MFCGVGSGIFVVFCGILGRPERSVVSVAVVPCTAKKSLLLSQREQGPKSATERVTATPEARHERKSQ